MAQFTGTVEWLDQAEGFGFVGRNDGPEVFVHCFSIQHNEHNTFREGESVEFDLVESKQGPQAIGVIRVIR